LPTSQTATLCAFFRSPIPTPKRHKLFQFLPKYVQKYAVAIEAPQWASPQHSLATCCERAAERSSGAFWRSSSGNHHHHSTYNHHNRIRQGRAARGDQGTDRGLDTPPAARSRIMAAVDALAAAAAASSNNNQRTVDRASGTWKLLWTTEKETLWILKNAGLFGTAAGDVFQVIDVDNGRLQNVIEFPPEGAFIVDSGHRGCGRSTHPLPLQQRQAQAAVARRDAAAVWPGWSVCCGVAVGVFFSFVALKKKTDCQPPTARVGQLWQHTPLSSHPILKHNNTTTITTGLV
jgi:hypothetical protein